MRIDVINVHCQLLCAAKRARISASHVSMYGALNNMNDDAWFISVPYNVAKKIKNEMEISE